MFFLKQKKVIFVVLIFLAMFVFAPALVRSAGLVPCGGDGEERCTVVHAFYLIARVTNWLLRVAGLFAVGQIIRTSWGFATAQGDEEAITTGKKSFTNIILGLCITMVAFMVINTIVNLLLLQGVKKCRVDLTKSWEYVVKIKESECQGGK